MNLVDLNPLLEELEHMANSSEKTASQQEELPLHKQAAEIAQKLRVMDVPAAGVDFHTQVDMMQKKASSVAREVLGLDKNRVGNPTPSEIVSLVFGDGGE